MQKKQFKLGLAPTRRDVFSRQDSLRYKGLIEEKLRSWGINFINLDGINEEGLLFNEADVVKAVELFSRDEVDAVFVPHCNFGTESAVAKLARDVGKPLLLWGPRDEAPLEDGTRLRDTQCGLFTTSKILRRLGVPFSYIVNSRVDSPVFERGVKNFIAAASAANAFLGARIGQVDVRPGPFWTMIVNEAELLEKWGIEVVPTTLVEITQAVEKKLARASKAVEREVRDFKTRVDFGDYGDRVIRKLAALKLVLLEWAEAESLDAIAFQCWTALQDALDICPCFVNSELTGLGIPVTCETDIHGALTSLLLQNAVLGERPTFFADLTIRHPEDENSELLWHCGPFPESLAAEDSQRRVSGHYILPSGAFGCAEWRIRGGEVTIARFDGDHGQYSLFMGEAKGTKGPYTRGTYLWIKTNNWPLWEEHLIYGPYVHHVVGIHGHISSVLYEACRFIPGLVPDPVEPTETQIRAWLRGENL